MCGMQAPPPVTFCRCRHSPAAVAHVQNNQRGTFARLKILHVCVCVCVCGGGGGGGGGGATHTNNLAEAGIVDSSGLTQTSNVLVSASLLDMTDFIEQAFDGNIVDMSMSYRLLPNTSDIHGFLSIT